MPEWSEEDMEKAIKAVRDGTMSQNKASLLYKIPKGTLNARLHDKYNSNKAGAPTKLSSKTEFFLYTMILFMADIGFGLTKHEIIQVIKGYLIESNQDQIFENNEPTDRWYYGFLSRFPDLTSRIANATSSLRATQSQPEIFDNWFLKCNFLYLK